MAEEKIRPIGLDFVMAIFFIRGIYWFYKIIDYFEPPWEFGDVVVLLFTIIFSGFYIVPAIGIYYGRRFGYQLALFMLCIEIPLLLIFFFMYPLWIVFGALFLGLLFYSLLKNKSYFQEFDETDRKVILGLVSGVILLLLSYGYWLTLPTPQDYYRMISKEAREKNDWRICNNLRDGIFWVKGWERVGGYRSECIKDFAVARRDVEVCRVISSINVRFNCYVDVAQALNNKSICDLIDEEIVNEGLQFNENRIDECKGLV